MGAVHVTVALVVPMFVTLTDTGGSGSGGTVLINEGKHFFNIMLMSSITDTFIKSNCTRF